MSKGTLVVMKVKMIVGNIYKLFGNIVVDGATVAESDYDTIFLWHMRLGNLSKTGMVNSSQIRAAKGS